MSHRPAKEQLHRQASDAEQLVYVDRDDQVLGAISRAELREQGLIGRCCFVFLRNARGDLCVHQRTFSKALYPGFWDVCAGGMVAFGESYEDSAQRELFEELGVHAPLTLHGHCFFDSSHSRLWCAVYSAVSDGPLILQPEEVLEAFFVPLDELASWLAGRPLCPDSLQAMALAPFLRSILSVN